MYCNIVWRGKGEGEGDFSCNLQEGPLCSFVKTQSRKNIWPFHVSQIISKTLSRSREIQGSQFD